jgi:hypothetical protein
VVRRLTFSFIRNQREGLPLAEGFVVFDAQGNPLRLAQKDIVLINYGSNHKNNMI